MAKKERELIVGLDIGTTKIAAVVGSLSSSGELEVLGIGTHPSKGLKKGVVVNIESAFSAPKEAA